MQQPNIIHTDPERTRFFDQLSETWDHHGPSPTGEKVRSFLGRLNPQAGQVVLDVGTGTGMMIPYIFEWEPDRVTAVDLSRRMLEKLEEKYAARFGAKLITLQGDIHTLDLCPDSVDMVICNGVYPHFYDKALALNRLVRCLKPGGVLAIIHFASREFINSVHGSASHELIRQDLLEPVEEVANLARKTGFMVRETADNSQEYFVIATKSS